MTHEHFLWNEAAIGIAISLLGNPDFLILDEPINGLDPEGVYEMRKMLETINRENGTTIMIASHILSELYKLATDYAIIVGGCLMTSSAKKRWKVHAAAASRLRLSRNICKMRKHSSHLVIRMFDVKFFPIKSCVCMRKSIRRISTNFWWKTKCVCVVWGPTMNTLRNFFVEKLLGRASGMKNLIRGHIYQLKKDNFFFGCLALGVIFLIVSIRFPSLDLNQAV